MPPAAIASSVVRHHRERVVADVRRSRNSSVAAGGNFGARPEAAVDGVEALRAAPRAASPSSSSVSGSARGPRPRDARDRLGELPRLPRDLAAPLAVRVGDGVEHLRGSSAARGAARREVRPAEERLARRA